KQQICSLLLITCGRSGAVRTMHGVSPASSTCLRRYQAGSICGSIGPCDRRADHHFDVSECLGQLPMNIVTQTLPSAGGNALMSGALLISRGYLEKNHGPLESNLLR